MNIIRLFFIIWIVFPMALSAQETTIDVDSIYKKAREFYREDQLLEALQQTKLALNTAPNYTDIRLLQINIEQKLQRWNDAETDIIYLKDDSIKDDLKPFVIRQIGSYKNTQGLINFGENIKPMYGTDGDVMLSRSEALLELKDVKSSRILLQDFEVKGLTSGQNYRFQELKRRWNTDQIGVNYEIISFLDDYPTTKSWNGVSMDYTHYFNKTAVAARAIYSNRFDDEGILYEVDAYPVFSKNFYSYANISASSADFYQNFGASLSLFYSIENVVEVEGGFRYLDFDSGSFFTPIVGLTKYVGRFYLNGRAFIGPEKEGKLLQNYQLNTRYYLKDAGNYLYLRLGTGISPDDRSRFTQVANNPDLVARYINVGWNQWFNDYGIALGAGYLNEDLSNGRNGNQIVGNVGLRYRL